VEKSFVRRRVGLGLRRWDWSSPAFSEEDIVVVTTVEALGGGGGAAAGDGLVVPALGAGGVLPSMCRVSMTKRTVATGGVFLGAFGRGLSKPVAVGALGVAVSLCLFFDLETF